MCFCVICVIEWSFDGGNIDYMMVLTYRHIGINSELWSESSIDCLPQGCDPTWRAGGIWKSQTNLEVFFGGVSSENSSWMRSIADQEISIAMEHSPCASIIFLSILIFHSIHI